MAEKMLRHYRVDARIGEGGIGCRLQRMGHPPGPAYFTWSRTFSDLWVMDIVEP
jgi:hypothetical protein